MRNVPNPLLALLAVATFVLPNAALADWPSFRGGGASVAAAGDSPPASWSIETGENVAWRADLPGRGVSGPILVGDRVIVTASDGPDRERLHVLAFDTASGRPLWRRKFWSTGRSACHDTSANAAPTPASDGERVFAFFSSNDLAALDLEGNVLWFRPLTIDHPGVGNDLGMASSPAVAGEAVVVQAESQGRAFAIGVDRRTGKTLWEVDRPRSSNWATPLVFPQADGGHAVLLQSPQLLSLHDAATGEELARLEVGCDGIPSAVPAPALGPEGVVVPSGGLTAYATLRGDEPAPLWRENPLRPGTPSPIVWNNQVLVVNGSGVLLAADLATGEVLWRSRLGGQHWATPVVAAGRAYCISTEGVAYVCDLNDSGRVLAEVPFGETVNGSPAVSGDAVYFRGLGKLWKIATPNQAAIAPRAAALR